MRWTTKQVLRSGVVTVEFALVAPVFLLLVFAVFEFARMMMVQQSLTNAAREGCRTAVLATTINSADVDKAVRDFLKATTSLASSSDKVRVTVPTNLANCATKTELTVAVEVDYIDVTWVPVGYLGLNPKIRAAQTSRRE